MSTDPDKTAQEQTENGSEADVLSEAEALEALAAQAEGEGLHHDVLSRYLGLGTQLLSDPLPSQVDPRLVKDLKPIIGDVSHVRIHTGETASLAARAMDARAFALGDADIFIDSQHYEPRSPEGRALLAHELAHAQDSRTDFALSAHPKGGPLDEREAFAESVETRVFALEDSGLDKRQAQAERDVFEGASASTTPPLEIDRDALAQRVFELLEAQQRHARDRHGS